MELEQESLSALKADPTVLAVEGDKEQLVAPKLRLSDTLELGHSHPQPLIGNRSA